MRIRNIFRKTISSLLVLLIVSGFIIPLPALATETEDESTIGISFGIARAGGLLDVAISLENNPGITGLVLHVNYDNTVMELVSYVNGSIFTESAVMHGPIYSQLPFILAWEDALRLDDITDDGVLVVLRFEIAAGAQLRDYPITVAPVTIMSAGGRLPIETIPPKEVMVRITEACVHLEVTQHKAATCTAPGYDRIVCAICKEILSDTSIPALGGSHGFVTGYVEATCVKEGGLMVALCPICGEALSGAALDPDNHTGGTYEIIIRPPSLTETGENGIYCSDCFMLIRTEDIPKLGADYSAVTAAIAEYDLRRLSVNMYTTDSWADLYNAVREVVYDLPVAQQTTVDGYAAAIYAAIENLVYTGANYYLVEYYISLANEYDNDLFSLESWDYLQTAINAVVYGLDASHQATVNQYAQDIYAAINALVVLGADYARVNAALAAAETLNGDLYTEESWAVLQEAIDCVEYNLNIMWQTDVDGYADAIYAAIEALVHGYALAGMIKSYNPKLKTTVKLMQGDNEMYEMVIPGTAGSGQLASPFKFYDVKPGTYTLVITKPCHTSFTVTDIAVGEGDLDLTKDSRPEVSLMTLRCGDIDGDGLINDADLTILWMLKNYNRKTDDALYTACDLNGDGMINDLDLTILWMPYNYYRGEIVIHF